MSEDEVFALVASCVLAGIFWIRWYRHCQAVTWLRCGVGLRLAVIAVPVACGALLWIVLRRLASHDVREAPQYLAMYFAMGAAWVGLGVRLLGLLGLSVRDDALERRNAAAAWAAAGGLIGLTLCFAGGNIGDGPGWWVVVYSALLSTGTLLLLWVILDRLTGVSESVTVERDVASGMRLGGFLAAAGLILGRAVAGRLGVGIGDQRRVPADGLAGAGAADVGRPLRMAVPAERRAASAALVPVRTAAAGDLRGRRGALAGAAGAGAMNAAMWTGAALAADAYAAVRRATIFRWGKWDPQFEDVSVLCDFPIILRRSEWLRVAAWAEQLAAETLAAEEELVRRPDLHKWLGLPRAVRRVLSRAAACPPCNGPRVMRFDFHLTTDGWRITEVNSDVPGGFIEASGFAHEVAACYPSLRVAGDPAAAYADAWARRLDPGALGRARARHRVHGRSASDGVLGTAIGGPRFAFLSGQSGRLDLARRAGCRSHRRVCGGSGRRAPFLSGGMAAEPSAPLRLGRLFPQQPHPAEQPGHRVVDAEQTVSPGVVPAADAAADVAEPVARDGRTGSAPRGGPGRLGLEAGVGTSRRRRCDPRRDRRESVEADPQVNPLARRRLGRATPL